MGVGTSRYSPIKGRIYEFVSKFIDDSLVGERGGSGERREEGRTRIDSNPLQQHFVHKGDHIMIKKISIFSLLMLL